jgi:hypothetical protein
MKHQLKDIFMHDLDKFLWLITGGFITDHQVSEIQNFCDEYWNKAYTSGFESAKAGQRTQIINNTSE